MKKEWKSADIEVLSIDNTAYDSWTGTEVDGQYLDSNSCSMKDLYKKS